MLKKGFPSGSGFRIALFVAFMLLALLFSVLSIRSQEPPVGPPLMVVSAIPQGSVGDQAETGSIQVTFSYPMVPLESVNEQAARAPMRIKPQIAGKFRWAGTATLIFEPSCKLPLASRFAVTIPEGTRSLDGFRLPHEYTWHFDALRPRVEGVYPRDGAAWVDPDLPPLVAIFNQAVSPEKIAPFVSLETEGLPLPVRAAAPEEKLWKKIVGKGEYRGKMTAPAIHQGVAILPEAPLQKGKRYILSFLPGLPGIEGSLGLEEKVSIAFTTLGPLAFLGPKEQIINPEDTLYLRFNNPVEYQALLEHLRFDPPVKIRRERSRDRYFEETLSLRLPLKPETTYKVTVEKGMSDQFQQRLGKAVTFTVKVKPYPPEVSMTTGCGIIESDRQLYYPLWIRSAPAVGLQMAALSPQDVIPFFKRVYEYDEEGGYDRGNKPLDVPRSFWTVARLRTLPKAPEKRAFPIDLGEALGEKKNGIILLQINRLSALGQYYREKYPRLTDSELRSGHYLPEPYYLRALVQCTQLGISGKFSPYSNLIWVTRLGNASPVAGADVEIRDEKNTVLWRGRTNEEGFVRTPGWKKLGIPAPRQSWHDPVQWVLVRSGDDLAVSSSRWGMGIYPWEFGIPYDWYPLPQEGGGFLFTERPVYRQGETVRLKGILRQKEDQGWRIPAFKKIYLQILDPRGETFFEKKGIILSRWGSFDLSIPTSREGRSGGYQIRASFKPLKHVNSRYEEWQDYRNLFYSSFEVAAYRPISFRVSVRPDRAEYFVGEKIKALASVRYLFGAPLSNEKVTWGWTKSYHDFTPPGREEYAFGGYLYGEDRPYYYSSEFQRGEGSLDHDGNLKITQIASQKEEKFPLRYTLEVTATGHDLQSVSGRAEVLVHPARFYAGIKTATMLAREGEPQKIEILAADPQGKILPGKKLTLTLIHSDWVSVRKAGFDGRYEWVSERKEEVESSVDIVTEDQPLALEITPRSTGFYLLRLEGTDTFGNRVRTISSFYATGESWSCWERHDDDRIELVADRPGYRIGETARILVKSPYPSCRALITLEREGVLGTKTAELKGSSPEIEIPITRDLIPNAFVGVILLHGRAQGSVVSSQSSAAAPLKAPGMNPGSDASEDLGKPSFKIGYLNLHVDPEIHHLSVSMETARKEYRPGEKVAVKVQVKDRDGKGRASEVTLACVDEGVLALMGASMKDPFDAFYGPRPLSVQTSETRIHVVGQRHYGEKGAAPEGGGGLPEKMKLRGNFETTPYWNPSVRTGHDGLATVAFRIPDNLTSFKVMGVAHSEDSSFGAGETTFKVNKPLVLLPSLPRFLRAGDRFTGGVIVHNNTGKGMQVSVSVQAKGALLSAEVKGFLPREWGQHSIAAHRQASRQGAPEFRQRVSAPLVMVKSLSLQPGESREVRFPFRALPSREARFVFKGVGKMTPSGEERDGLEITIPTAMALATTEEVAECGSTTASRERLGWVKRPEGARPDAGGVKVTLSPTAFAQLKGSARYLLEYPYGCFEQRTSRIFPIILASEIIEEFDLDLFGNESAREVAQKGIDGLIRYQTPRGGFCLWPGGQEDYPYLTAYGVAMLEEALKHGYRVDRAMLERARDFLKQRAKGFVTESSYPYSSEEWDTIDAFSLYALSLVGGVIPGTLDRAYEKRNAYSYFSLALLYRTMARERFSPEKALQIRRILENGIKVDSTSAHVEEPHQAPWLFGSNVKTTAAVLQAFLEVDGDHPLATRMVRWLLNERRNGYWHNTHDNAFVLWALSEYFQKYEREAPAMKAEIFLGQKELLKAEFLSRTAPDQSRSLSMPEVPESIPVPLSMTKKGPGRIYYEVRMRYALSGDPPAVSNGLFVQRWLETLKGERVEPDRVVAGQVLKVCLRVTTREERHYVALVDYLPAGFEPIYTKFLTEQRHDRGGRIVSDGDRTYGAEDEYGYWWMGFNHSEKYDDHLFFSSDFLGRGEHSVSYLVRVTGTGSFHLPPASAFEMYAPEVFGRTVSRVVTVSEERRISHAR